MKTPPFAWPFALAVSMSVASCAQWPDWVMNPVAENGIAAADCAEGSGNLSVDRQFVVASARTALAQQISTRVKAVDKVYSERVAAAEKKPVASTSFQRASALITDQALQNSRVARFEVVGKQVCALVIMDAKDTRKYFDDLVQVAKVEVTPQLEEKLFDTFRARKVGP